MRKVVGPWAREARKRPHGRSLADFLPLLPAEGRLREAVATGEICELAADCRRARQMLALRFVLPPGEYADAVAQVLADEDAPGPLKAILRAETGLVGDKPLLYDVCVATLRQHEARSELQSGEALPQSAVPAETEALTARTEELPEIVRDFPRELVRIASRHLDTPKDGWRAALDTDPDALLAVYTEVAERYRREVMGWRSVDESDPDVVVRGSFVRFLALGGDDATPVHEKGVMLIGAVCPDGLDLESACDVLPLLLGACRLRQPITFRNATINRLILSGSLIDGLAGDSLESSGNIFFRNGFRSKGSVRLTGATIGANLDCSNSTFLNRGPNDPDRVLLFDRAVVRGSVFLGHNFRAEGEVFLLGAQIEGNLQSSGATLVHSAAHCSKPVLSCDGARIGGDTFFDKGFRTSGEVRLLGATIGGDVDCSGAVVQDMNLGRANVSGSVLLISGFRTKGKLTLVGATIGGNLDCSGGTFINVAGHGSSPSLICDRIRVGGSVFLTDGFNSTGEVRLSNARIGNELECTRGTFGRSIATDERVTVPQSSSRQVTLFLQSARIANGLILRGATFHGSLDLTAGHCGTLVDDAACWNLSSNESFIRAQSPWHVALDGFTYERFAGTTIMGPGKRIRWLDRQPESHLTDSFRPQPWEQLAKVYRASGHEDWARVIAKEKQRRLMRLQRQAAWATLRRGEEIWRGAVDLAVWLVSWLFRGLLGGYGYAVKRLFVIPLAVWLLCAQLFDQAAEQGLVVPSAPILVANKAKPGDPDTVPAACRANWTRCPPPTLPTEYRRFSPHLYSADLLLPFVSFGQEDAWTPLSVPDLPRQTSATVPARPDSSMKLQGLYGWIDWRLPWWAPRLVMWSEIVAGWLMGVLVVGVLSGLVKKD